MAARGITVRWSSSRCIVGVHDGIRTRIEATDACEMTEKIFAYRLLPRNPQTGEQAGVFSHICSPVDLEEFPADEPVPGQQPAWFRLAYVDVLLRSMAETENFIQVVREDVRRLKDTLDRMDVLLPAGEEVIGESCPAVSSSSDSSESSESSEAESSSSAGALLSLTRVGTFEQTTGVGIDWTHVDEGAGSPIGVSDSMGANYSAVVLSDGLYSKMLLVQGFDFCALPDGATIVGIEAQVTLRRDSTGSSASLSASFGDASPCPIITVLSLYHPDAGLTANRAGGDCVLGDTFYDIVEGADDDLWNKSWTPADLKRGEFGLGLVIGAEADLEECQVAVDGVEITVYYRN